MCGHGNSPPTFGQFGFDPGLDIVDLAADGAKGQLYEAHAVVMIVQRVHN